jgi:ribose transport system permease protein
MRKELGLAVLILVIGCIVALLQPRFISTVNLVNMANLVGLYGLFSIGQGLVIITAGIELSVGSVFALIGVVFVDMVVNWGWSWPLALAAAIGMGGVFGAIHGFLVARVGIQPFVVTLCALLIYRGAARYYTDDATVGFGYGGDFDTLADFATGRSFGVPNTFLTMVLVALVMWVVLHRSVFGRYLFAVGKNEEAARYSGISTRAVIASAYVICGLLAGLAAVFLAFYTNSIQPSAHGNFYELYAIAAAVLGGCSLRGGEGSILGIILGTVLLQVLQNLVNLLGIPSSLNFAVMGTVILIGVLADQHLQKMRTARLARAVPAAADRPAPAVAGSSSKP